MKWIFVAAVWTLLLSRPVAAEATEPRDFSAAFGSYSGAFVLYEKAHKRWIRYRPEQCRTRSSPCSTFKVLNSLIALETGVADGPDFRLSWDGTRRSIEAWNRDQTLRSAFSSSCVWYYQALASRIGSERYQQIIPKIGYGNNDLSGGLVRFWLQSSLSISPDEQVEFLRRLHSHKLPFSEKTVNTVLDIMTIRRSGSTIFRGKTGSGSKAGGEALGWFIGSVSKPSGDYLFATRIIGDGNPSGAKARKITESILSSLKILPAPKNFPKGQ